MSLFNEYPILPDHTRRECLIEVCTGEHYIAKYNEVTGLWMLAQPYPTETVAPELVLRWAYIDELKVEK